MVVSTPVRWLARRPPPVTPIDAFDPAHFTPALKTRLLILQPTPFCNIDCDYCYLPDRRSTARMSLATMRRAAERLLDDKLLAEQLTVVWHAGEPLTLPVGYFEAAIGVLDEVLGGRCRLSHSIQTNATLIDADWCVLIKRHDIRIGVSVDGPVDLHDAHRRTRTGRGTHARVLLSLDADRIDLSRKGVKRTDKDFPVIWAKNYGKGRVLYNGLGHVQGVWERPEFQKMWLEMVQWSLGLVPGEAAPRGK